MITRDTREIKWFMLVKIKQLVGNKTNYC